VSEDVPEGLYVYQPFGAVSHPEQDDRLYAVSGFRGVGFARVTIEGLTSNEAHRVCEILQAIHDDRELEYHREQVDLLYHDYNP
jgi:hypothetical protein